MVTRMETYLLRLGFWFTVVLGGMALALTVSGLFSVLSYSSNSAPGKSACAWRSVRRRGMSRGWCCRSRSGPVGVGLVVGGGSAAGIAALLLAMPAAGPIGEIVHVLDPVAYAVSLLIILAACLAAASIPASRAARLDPTTTLRQE